MARASKCTCRFGTQSSARAAGHTASDALAAEGIESRIHARRERLIVEAATPRALEVVTRVFGIQSLSPTERGPGASLDAIVCAGFERFRDAVAGRRMDA